MSAYLLVAFDGSGPLFQVESAEDGILSKLILYAQQRLLHAAFFGQLADQEGRGLLFETEGSVITDTWRTQARSYNTALRQAARMQHLVMAYALR